MNTALLNGARPNGPTFRDDTLRLYTEARTTATNSVRRPMAAQCSSDADTFADGLKITGVSLAAADAVAADHAIAVRVVKPTAQTEADVASTAVAVRSAYFAGGSTGHADVALPAPWARRPFDGEAVITSLTYAGADRTAWMAGTTHLGSASVGIVAGRTRPFTAYTVASAETQGRAERTAWTLPSATVAKAEQREAFERHAYFDGAPCSASATSQGSAQRTAWGRFNIAMGIADRIGKPVRTAWMSATTSVVGATAKAQSRRTTRMLSEPPSTIEASAEQVLATSALYWRTPEPMEGWAEASLDVTRFAWAPAPAMEGVATFAVEATRYGWSQASAEAEAELVVDALRTAWAIPETMAASAITTASGWHTYHVEATSEASADASVEYRWWSNAQLRPIRTASLTWLAESRLKVLRVRQRAMSGTGIARSSSRALSNTKILLGTLSAHADTESRDDALRLYRNVSGVAEAGVESVTNLGRITVISGNPNAVAELRVAPTVIREGVRYSYVDGQSVAEAVQECAALNITKARLRSLLPSALAKGVAYLRHAFAGKASVTATSLGGKVRSNRWRTVEGTSRPEALGKGRAINLRWIGMQGAAAAVAEGRVPGLIHYRWTPMEGSGLADAVADGEAIRYRWVGAEGVGDADSESFGAEPQRVKAAVPVPAVANLAESSGSAVREVRPDIEATGLATVDLKVTVYAWRFVELHMVGRCVSQADGLRKTWAPRGKPMLASAGDVRVSFKINAGSPAPAPRTLVVAPENRTLRLPATKREYTIA